MSERWSGERVEEQFEVALAGRESAVLVLAEPFGGKTPVVSRESSTLDRVVLVSVEFGGSAPTSWLDAVRDRHAVVGEEVVTPAARDTGESGVTYREVSGPDDLTSYGVALSQTLEAWENATVVVVLDSLTTLLQHVSSEAAFRFIHVLAGRSARESGILVCQLNPAAHDDQTVASLMQPFDVVVDTTGEELVVRRRS